jgi:isopentenyl diphosphate isomerase/L-lactate dehydrogenase-like FMN-dependent dehydrogenase
MNVSTLEMNLDAPLFGQTLFTPIIVGPIADQGRYHPEAEIATIRGAAAANTLVIVSNHSTAALDRIAQQANGPFWYSVYANEPGAADQARSAVAAGAGAVFITVRSSYAAPGANAAQSPAAAIDWRAVAAIRQGLTVPVIVKGIVTAEDAAAAVREGVQGVVVSNHAAAPTQTSGTTIEGVSAIADAVGGRIPILADGSFRRGTDVLKALILGAQAVLMARPIMWGLAGYGAEGVQYVLQLTQHELARSFGMVGASTPGELTRDFIRVHRIATS